MAKDGGFCR